MKLFALSVLLTLVLAVNGQFFPFPALGVPGHTRYHPTPRVAGGAGCMFRGSAYPDGYLFTEQCMEMKCNDGCWEYTGQFNKDCGNCTFGGVHLVFPFDPLSNSPNATTLYRLGFTDYDYTMVQPYFDDAAEYGVKAHYH